jgi:hypothetical protein
MADASVELSANDHTSERSGISEFTQEWRAFFQSTLKTPAKVLDTTEWPSRALPNELRYWATLTAYGALGGIREGVKLSMRFGALMGVFFGCDVAMDVARGEVGWWHGMAAGVTSASGFALLRAFL